MDGSVTHFFKRLQNGDESAARHLWERFFPRLLGLARKTLYDRPQRVTDAEDAVQNAFFSFWQRAIRGEFKDVNDRDDLWNLLGIITVRKALNQAKREAAQKRGGGRVVSASVLTDSSGEYPAVNLEEGFSRMPTHEFDLTVEELLLVLEDKLRGIAILRLMGYQITEIASLLEYNERTIRRKIHLIKLTWQANSSE